MTKVQAKRLLNVARALRESPAPHRFTMQRYCWPCGTPACALGHYAARSDLQRTFTLDEYGALATTKRARCCLPNCTSCAVETTFGIDSVVAYGELFGPDGCGRAKTTEEAAQFIEDFVVAEGHGDLL